MLTDDRNNGIGRIYTSNVAMAGRGPCSFSSLEEVIKVFGNGSDEANAAKAFFDFIEVSHCSNLGIQFASWGYGGNDPYKRFTATGSAADGFTFTNLDTESETTYASLKEAFDAIGGRAIVSIKLTGDVLYISNATKDDSERYAALSSTCGASNLNATDDEDKLNGFIVGAKQIVVLDLNGHKMCGDCNVIRNLGYMTINDSVGTGCVFTTNFEKTIGGASHSSRFENTSKVNRATTEAVRNEGSLTINGGWYGTDRATDSAWVNEVNWGQCLACHGESATIVNGGHFTTVTHSNSQSAPQKLSSDVGQTSWLASRKFTKADGWNYSPYAAIVDTYDRSQVQWNGGECYGLYNDIFEVEGGGTTAENPGGVQIFGGEFYAGFKGFTFTPSSSFSQQSMFQASVPAAQYLPSELPPPGDSAFCGWSPIIIYAGTFRDNISLYTADGKRARSLPPRGRTAYPDPALNMTGRVSVLGGDFNFSFSSEFANFRQTYEFRGLTKAELTETKTNAIKEAFKDSDDLLTYGVFGFAEGETKAEATEVCKLLVADNFRHIYCVTGNVEISGDGIAPLDSVNDMWEVCRAFQPLTARRKNVSA